MGLVHEKSGISLVTDVLMPGRIRFRNNCFLYRNGKHAVRDIVLSDELKALVPDAEELSGLLESVLKLYLRAEKERALRFEIPEDSVLRAFLPDAHVTGMTFLNLFTNGVLRLLAPEEPEGSWTLASDPVFREAVPEAERKLWLLFRLIQAFGNEHLWCRIIFEEQELVRTVELEQDMTLTYEWDREFERIYIQGECPEETETERERAVRLNREASLQKTLELIRSINEEASADQEEEEPKHD